MGNENVGMMIIKMMLEGRLIGSADVEPQRIKSKGYLQGLCESLRHQNKEALARCTKPPTFLLEIPTSNG